jgi:hypothetical protein
MWSPLAAVLLGDPGHLVGEVEESSLRKQKNNFSVDE